MKPRLERGFAFLELLNLVASRRTLWCRAAERVPQQCVKVDSPFAGRGFVAIEDVSRLHQKVHRLAAGGSKSTQIEERGVSTLLRCLNDDVVDRSAQSARELTTTTLNRVKDRGQVERVFVSLHAECSHFPVVAVRTADGVEQRPGPSEGMEAKRHVQAHAASRMPAAGGQLESSREWVKMRE